MLSPAESGNGVSHVPESTPESAADAVGAGFDFGAIVKRVEYPNGQWKKSTSGNCA
jgi:hypothetical protein